MFFRKKNTNEDALKDKVFYESYVVCSTDNECADDYSDKMVLVRAKTRQEAAEDFFKYYPKYNSCEVYMCPTSYTCTRELKVKEIEE